MKGLDSKKIYLNEATIRNLQGLKAERIARGLTQSEIASELEIPFRSWRNYERQFRVPRLQRYILFTLYFGWDMETNPNCIFYKLAKKSKLKSWVQMNKDRYGYTISELAESLDTSITAVEDVVYGFKTCTLLVFGRMYELFEHEKKQEQIREGLLI